jgi:hypothetical protein
MIPTNPLSREAGEGWGGGATNPMPDPTANGGRR